MTTNERADVGLAEVVVVTLIYDRATWLSILQRVGSGTSVTVIHAEGTEDETRVEVRAHIQPETGFFDVDAPVYEGDVVVVADPRGGLDRRLAETVKVYNIGRAHMRHTEVTWAKAPPVRVAPVRRLTLENLHPEVVAASGDLFTDGHYASAILEAFKRVESACSAPPVRADWERPQDLMAQGLRRRATAIDVRVEDGQSGQDEQEGFRFMFMGAVRGIRNPKAHEAVSQLDPQRALEYLGFASILDASTRRRVERS